MPDKLKPIRTHTFNGTKHDVTLMPDGIDGYCLDPNTDGIMEICIAVPLSTRIGLETAIHEATHALCPKLREEDAHTLGHELARWLWRLDYRTRRP